MIGYGFLVYAADPGEMNDVTVSQEGAVYTITDSGAMITPGMGCVGLSAHQVRCAQEIDPGLVHFEIFVRDGDDKVTVSTSPAGNAMANKLNGEGGNDTLTGGPGNDEIQGLDGDDTLTGGGGADLIWGGLGADAISGGAGRDMARYNDRGSTGVTVAIDGVADDGSVDDGPPGARDNVATDVEDLEGGAGDDSLSGSSAANRLFGNTGSDQLNGLDGDDVFYGDRPVGLEGGSGVGGADVMSGGGGTDQVDYTEQGEVTVDLDGVADDGRPGENDNAGADVEDIVGGIGNDVLTGNAVANVIDGGGGGDLINGLGGGDTVNGGPGPPGDTDFLHGGGGNDTLDYGTHLEGVTVDLDAETGDDGAGEGDTTDGFESLIGGSGDDILVGDAQANLLSGGPGGDVLDGGAGADVLSGGAGSDAADYSLRSAAVTVSLDGSVGDGEAGEGDLVGSDIEDALGGAGNDTMSGSAADNSLIGGGGNDLISGHEGEDLLVGDAGDDSLDGNADEDLYLGEDGNDSLQTRDGTGELVLCGAGADSVVADGPDETIDCETVSKPAPVVDSGSASAITQTSATITGSVDPSGQGTNVYLEVGTSTAYGFRSPPTDIGNGVGPVALGATLTGLQPGTTYHFRFVATNPAGATFGENRTFTTLPGDAQPPVTHPRPPRPRVLRCVVPNVRGKKLATARAALRRAHCRAGKVKLAYSTKIKRGRVIAQKPKPRARLRNQAKVDLVVSRGPRKR
jgi:Ca2+-binding RTX toxin-like protein